MSMKEFDINIDELKVLETPEESTDFEKEVYYLKNLNNDEWGFNKEFGKFVFKIKEQIYYAKLQLIQFRCCGQPPAELVGCILEKETTATGEVITRIVKQDMGNMPFKIKDETALMKYCFVNLF